MSESFSDLWTSVGPAKPQQLPLKSLVATANNSDKPNGSRRTTPDVFSMLASASSSQPSSRPITPSVAKQPAPSKPTSSNATDAFGGLISFGAAPRDDGLTIAERTAKAERERKEQAKREQATLTSQDAFWDQFETDFTPATQGERKEQTQTASSSQGAFWDQFETDFSFATNTSKPASVIQADGIDDILGSLAKPVEEVRRTSPRPVPPKSPSPRASSPPPGTDEDDILGSLAKPVEEVRRTSPRPVPPKPPPPRASPPPPQIDEDDILGSLAKPVEEVRRTSPRPPSPPVARTSNSRASSPPPHIVGRIVEMGFSVQQAKIALAATDSGLDVDSALEILLENDDSARPAERERERELDYASEETERIWRRRHAPPSRANNPSPDTSSRPAPPAPGTQQGQADKLLAQASTIGLSMFNKANAFWKEGREKVAKVYEEQRAGGEGRRGTGRPRWMDELPKIDDNTTGVVENFVEEPPARRPAVPASTSTSSTPSVSQAKLVSRPPTPPPVSRPPPPVSRPPPPPPVSRPTPTASPSAIAVSNAHRQRGTDHFKLGRFAESEVAYSSALGALPAAHLLRVPLCTNRALVRLRTGDYKGTVQDASEAVEIITGDLGSAWHPGREAEGGGGELGVALGKALRRRAEAYEGMEKWREAMADWERLSAASWVDHALRGDAIKGAGRSRRILSSGGGSPTQPAVPRAQPAVSRPKPKPNPTRPSEALTRVRDANAAQDAEEQARYELKDGVDARLAAWRAGKETNLRALLASLDTVLWPELGWQKIGMAELVSPGQVKVRYTKAISKLHPDKLHVGDTNTEQRMIASGVFGTLNEAWNAFR